MFLAALSDRGFDDLLGIFLRKDAALKAATKDREIIVWASNRDWIQVIELNTENLCWKYLEVER